MKFDITKKQLKVDSELINICKEIKAENKNDREWSLIESSDQYQSKKYCGGYEAIEQCFWFSYYKEENEYWFDFALADIDNLINGKLQYLELRKSDS